MHRQQKWLTIIGAIIIVLLLVFCYIIFSYLYRARQFPEKQITYILSPGMTTKQLANDLYHRNILRHPHLFAILVRLEGKSKHLQSGEYRFVSGMNLQALINKLADGDVVRYEFTIVDGWTFKQLREVLRNNRYLKHKLAHLSSAQIADLLHLRHADPEGLFLAETYQFTWHDSDIDILKRAHRALQIVLKAEWRLRTTGNVYKTPYQALIVASMLEKETSKLDERSKISGVIYRRLQKGMRLQIDPTVIYALGNRFTGKLHRRDLNINSPYNTYRHYGLPPTPIAICGVTAIHTALQPDSGSELYFVAKGNGSHHFSSTLKAHDRAVLKYLLNNK